MSAVILRRAASLLGLSSIVPLEALGPFVTAKVLAWVDVYAVALLAARFDEHDPDVLLAAALANRAPRHGHTAVDLQHLEVQSLRTEQRAADASDDARADATPAVAGFLYLVKVSVPHGPAFCAIVPSATV